MTLETMLSEIVDELKDEFQNQPTFNLNILQIKVKEAYRKVRSRKCYENTSKTENDIIDDLYNRHYQDIKDVAAYNFAKIGGYFENSHTENNTSRSWITENEVLGNINAFPRILQ